MPPNFAQGRNDEAVKKRKVIFKHFDSECCVLLPELLHKQNIKKNMKCFFPISNLSCSKLITTIFFTCLLRLKILLMFEIVFLPSLN